MKKKLLVMLLCLCMAIFLVPAAAFAADTAFSDTSGHWAQSAIETWAGYDVLKGSDGAFRPNDTITRAELAAVLNRIMGYTAVTDTAAFTDVPADAWYYNNIAKLYAAGIMLGYGWHNASDSRYHP